MDRDLRMVEAASLDQGGERVAWEHHHVSLTRVPGYGFGIAVSGGRDNPHFANGDPAIAISDVLKAGPAEGKLLVNDRIISANGISLENVEYATAVQVLRDSGNTVLLAVRRRVVLPSYSEPHTVKLSLTKTSKKDDFGLVLGSKIFVREVANKCLSDKEGNTIQDGDILLKINNHPTEGMTLKEARKLIESSKDKLNLVVRRENRPPLASLNHHLEHTTLPKESHGNYLDGLHTPGGNYSSQNLYVQPPSRHALSHAEDKSNLVPRGRSRGPLLDVSLSQLDRPATPPSHHHAHSRSRSGLDEPADALGPPRPPPPRPEVSDTSDYYSSRRQLYEDDPLLQRSKQPMPDPRFITFQKEGSVGIRLTGGNEVGIFVTAVQPGSPASLQGLQPGDKILKVNDMDMKGVTREEAVLFLLSLQDQIDLIVQLRRDEYEQIVALQRGDSFHIKAHFNYDQPNKGEMSFRKGDVFHVTDTLHNGVVGAWQVFRIGRNNQEVQKGIIPNKSRAEELATAQFNATKKELTASESRGSFFRRRRGSHRRSKSLGKEHWDDVVFSDSVSKFPAYERVVLRHPGFVRPVVLFGPVADLAREKMLGDFPDKFTSPQSENLMEELPKSAKASGIIRLSAIREIMECNKHALLDITPNAVDRLNYAQFYPIVIFLRADNKHVIKELRAGLSKAAHKSSKKLFEQCQKLDKIWGHTFSCSVTLSAADSGLWYRKVRELVDKNQTAPLWMSETKPAACLSDDFLFPMTSRLSYASSPESDLELPGAGGSRLVKSSSDPSVATQDDTTPTYAAPPPYSPAYAQGVSEGAGPSKRRTQPADSKYGFSPPGGNESMHGNYAHHHHGMANGHSPSGLARSPLTHSPGHAPELPPRVDRSNKPSSRSAAERLFGRNDVDNDDPPNYINATPHLRAHASSAHVSSLDRHNLKTQSSYDSVSSYESYRDVMRLGPNAHDDLKSNGTSRAQLVSPNHDPYRFTRSTAQPVGRSQAKLPPPPAQEYAKYRPSEYKPAPPSKSNSYKPVPPPKPKHYRPPGTDSWDKYQHGKSYSSVANGNGDDSGQGSSLDRARGSQYYYNVPPHVRNSTGLDLANREQRGSAFELYKKPTVDARHVYLDNQLR